MPEEKLIQKLKPHPLAYFFYYLCGFFLILSSFFSGGWAIGISISLIGILIIAVSELIRRAETFFITEDGIAREFNFISKSRTFAEYAKVQDTHVSQNVFDRIFSIGNININTAGSPHAEIVFKGIKNPYGAEKQIREKI